MILKNTMGDSLEPIDEEMSEESEKTEEVKENDQTVDKPPLSSHYPDNQIHVSFYYPFVKRFHNELKHEIFSESESEEEDTSNDMIAIALRFYHRMSVSKKIHFFETIFLGNERK